MFSSTVELWITHSDDRLPLGILSESSHLRMMKLLM